AVIDGMRYDEHEIEQQAQQSEKNVTDYLESNNIGTIRPLTEEESAAVTSGEITEQDAVKIVTGSMTLEEAKQNKAEQDKAGQNNTQQQKPDSNTASQPQSRPSKNNTEQQQPEDDNRQQQSVDYDALISEKVAQLYIVKANFYAEFNSAWAAEKAAYLALPKEQRKKGKIAEIVKSKMGEGLAMEKKYDGQVDAIITELKELLTAAGRSTELADTVKEAYNQEKKAKKAQLINKYFG
ncbi:MAG: hypothetical protein IJ365_06005, partial [Clostridia bacterium]|nr:hypothetical protein [Clostridia bacterium]